jgi:hypothetical protein
MRFLVEDQPNNLYAIVPEGREPLPALFDSREQALRLANKLSQRAIHKTRPKLASGR